MSWWGVGLPEAGVFDGGAYVSGGGVGSSGMCGLLLGDEVVVEGTQHDHVIDSQSSTWLPLVCLVGFKGLGLGASAAYLQCCPALVTVAL